MPGAIRKEIDNSAGHCYPPRAADAGSPDVIINGYPVVRVGDHYPTHCCGIVCHDGVASMGSSTVIVNGKPLHRVGDEISCGDIGAN